MLELIAQLVAPPLQNSPIRLPGPDATEQRLAPDRKPAPVELDSTPQPEPQPGPKPDQAPTGDTPALPLSALPDIRGLSRYSQQQLETILASCRQVADPAQRLTDCAAALTARLVADGYVNSRVYVEKEPAPGHLEVVEGRLVELRVTSVSPRLQRKVFRLLKPLQGQVLHLPTVQRDLQLLRRVPGVGDVKGSLSRLGSDPSQAIFSVAVQAGSRPWQGEFSIRNDGSPGSGEYRGSGALVKGDLATPDDILLLYGEMNWTNNPDLGSLITSVSYTLPLGESFNITGSFGYSKNYSPEFDTNEADISSDQLQGLGQAEYVFKETLSQRWSVFLGASGNRNTIEAGLPNDPDLSVTQNTSYVRLGVAGNGLSGPVAWGGNAYLLQALSSDFIDAGSATAVGGLVSAGWAFAPSWQLNGRLGGQLAFNNLPTSMYFSLGSDVGLRGLPGQLVSGENGWLGTLELAWAFWQNRTNTLQLVPFIGAGGVNTALDQGSFNDTVGSTGLLARWLAGQNWAIELGYVHQFNTNDNLGVWNDWILDDGLYAKVQFRF